MVVAFTITEINYLMVSLFCDLVLLLFYLYLQLLSSLTALLLVSGTATKTAMASQSHSPYSCKSRSYQVIFKQIFFLSSVLQIFRFIFFFLFFILGIFIHYL